MIGNENARLVPLAQVHAPNQLALGGSVVSLGSFDGVHRGHQEILKLLARSSAQRGLASVVYTFDPPPKVVFGGAMQLTDGQEKVRRISYFGIDHIVLANFDKDYAARSAQDFIAELAKLSPREVWVGEDFRFGAGRAGDVTLLQSAFKVRIMNEFTCVGGERVSSSRIREFFSKGRLDEARALHGWPDTARWSFSSPAQSQANKN